MASEGATVNDALLQVGNIGRYQLFMLFWAFLCSMLTSMQSLVMVFTQAHMGFRCSYEDTNLNQSVTANSTAYGSCQYPNSDICTDFVYNSSVYTSSIVSQFDLVCSRSLLPTVANSVFMLARIPGGLLTGRLLDRIGRKKSTVVALFFLGGFGVATAYSIDIAMYIIFRCLVAFPIMVVYDGCATFLSEVTTPHKRPHILIALIYGWGAGILILSPLGYWIRDWRTLQMVVSVPSFVICFAAIWVFDESPHWLYSQGRYKEAQEVLNKIANWNSCTYLLTVSLAAPGRSPTYRQSDDKAKLEPDYGTQIDVTAQQPEKKNQLLQILRNKSFLIILAICSFGWLACNMGYSGLAFGLGNLVGDVYLNNLFGAAAEIVSYCIVFLVILGGRKIVYIVLLAIGGVALIASAVIQDYLPNIIWLIITTTMIGRLSVAAGWQIMYLWCIELFPTTVRVTMLEISMWVGHIGSAASPFVNDLPKVITDPAIRGAIIAPALYGVLLLISSGLSVFLPETNNKALPVDVDEASANYDKKVEDTGV